MMPGKTMRKAAPTNPAAPLPSSEAESEAVAECALQLCKIGDKWNLRQRILNLISKLFCPGT
ncbi:phorbol-12-myristate-13-acetate-induced protein 1 [Sceloporus undulatus]|uniref:phorbol-12-myristate-13-acetate-induced protein 1 n=1 Tax=Sceloporus undulatus TaxID=8520 RepID=UPI001C4A874F|nr:phorbol-12-myristate-13-acetate-induced protein 1 [Sceloporus undulatus]